MSTTDHSDSKDAAPSAGGAGVDEVEPSRSEGYPLLDDWGVTGDGSPCAVYAGSAATLGRVTTPLGDLHFTNLFGSPVAMMRTLGKRSASDIRDGALAYLNRFLFEVVDALLPSPVAGVGCWAAENWLFEKTRNALSPPYQEALQAFAEGSGHAVDEVVAGQLAWDLWALLACSSSKRMQRAAARARRHAPLLDSASLVLPSETAGPLHLRWLDNAAVDRWDRKTAVSFFHPNRGMSYALVSSVGFVAGLPAGMNAAGLTISVEPGISSAINDTGKSVAEAAHQILRQAHTIEEASAILRQYHPLAPWRYVFCEGDTGRSAVYSAGETIEEITSGGAPPFALVGGDGVLPGRRSARISRWHDARRQALDQVVDEWSPTGEDAVFSALEAMFPTLIGSSVVPIHPLGGPGNVGAVVFEPAQRRLWVAAGRAPVSRRWFVPLTFRSGDTATAGGLDSRVRPLKPGGDWEDTDTGRAMEQLRHALQLDLSGEAPQRILITLEHALALDPSQASFHILAGLMALRAGRGRRATGAFQKAIDRIDDPVRRAEVGVYLAWSLDVQKRRLPARRLYAQIAAESDIEPTVRRWARRGRRRRFRRRDAQRLDIDFFLACAHPR